MAPGTSQPPMSLNESWVHPSDPVLCPAPVTKTRARAQTEVCAECSSGWESRYEVQG